MSEANLVQRRRLWIATAHLLAALSLGAFLYAMAPHYGPGQKISGFVLLAPPIVWSGVAVTALVRFHWRAAWVLLGAPFALGGQLFVGLLLYACATEGQCL